MYAFLKEWWEAALADRRGMSERATCVPVERGQKSYSTFRIGCRGWRKRAYFVLVDEWIIRQ